jgi:hypothetical protein
VKPAAATLKAPAPKPPESAFDFSELTNTPPPKAAPKPAAKPAASPPPTSAKAETAATPPPAPRSEAAAPTKVDAAPSKRKPKLIGAAVVGGVLVLGGILVASYLQRPASELTTAVAANTQADSATRPTPNSEPKQGEPLPVAAPTSAPATPVTAIVDPAPPKEPAPMPEPAKPPAPMPKPKERELTEDEKKVNEAVAVGVEHLKRHVDTMADANPPKGNVPAGRPMVKFGGHDAGIAGLVGLTLLECGVPADEQHVVKLAKIVRAYQAELNHTYSLALAIFFLERLADPKDRALIETYAMRLVAGQTAAGGWSYNCPILTAAEEAKFVEYLRTNAYVAPGSKASRPQGSEKLSARLKAAPVVVWQRGGKPAANAPGMFGLMGGDNSNTQFALLGLWVAKRVGVPTQPSLNFVAQHFRQTQCGDGGWGYSVMGGGPLAGRMGSTPSMTCAGLLGLAVGRGVTIRADEPGKKPAAGDPVTTRGLRALDNHIKPIRDDNGKPGPLGIFGGHDLYLYWSLERTAMIYDLNIIAGKEWYPWLSKLLVGRQQRDGSWGNAIHDDCFALLVLRRVNIAKDLTSSLRSLNIKDMEAPENKP